MEKKKDLRQSLPAKCAAILLVFAAAAAAVLGTCAIIMLSCGYGVAGTFEDDLLGREAMDSAMRSALYYSIGDEQHSAYYYQVDLERAGGFSALVYAGRSAGGTPAGSWGEIPQDALCQMENTYEIWNGEQTVYYTVVGYLSKTLPAGSDFSVRFGIYNMLRSLSFSVTVLLTALAYAVGMAALIFLCCAAGHKAGREGISLNWQDRIPLDLYLFIAVVAFCAVLIPVTVGGGGVPMALEIAICCMSVIGGMVVALAVLLTLTTRFKKGKWWRNTIIWRLCRWSVRTWKRCWRAIMELVRILPMTWRTILAVIGILGIQSLLCLETYEGFFFFLLAAVLDAALVVAAAWMSLQLQKVRDMGSALAAGDLDAQLDTEKMYFDVKRHAEDLNAIGVGMNKAVEQRLKSERLKTELITNVSHDIKTPLTSIVNYVDLLKKEDIQGEKAKEYIEVLDRKSQRLKKLTEDLVEASKASTGAIAINKEKLGLVQLVNQALGEYSEKFAAANLTVVPDLPDGEVTVSADGRHLWRVLDNLLGNCWKYAMPGTRVYIDLREWEGSAVLSVKNVSAQPLNIPPEQLLERFVRGDESRTTEGSGLGLSIAQNLTELQGGAFRLEVDGDLFKAVVTLPVVK